MIRQSIGVTPLKHLIKWCYPEATAAFDACAAQHDKDYKTVDWSTGPNATLRIDLKFRACCLEVAGQDEGLRADAELFCHVARHWGRTRAWLWKLGIRY